MPLASNSLAFAELVIGIASAIGCGSIVCTYLFFPKLRKLRYIELVYYVAINDLMASIGMALGPSENGSAACWYQGLSSTGNYLSSVFWTSVITYQVYAVVVKEGRVIQNMTRIHILCWGLPLFLTFIPLSTSTYSNPDDEATWCFVADRAGSPSWSQFFWFIVSFYAWLWMAMLWSAFMLVSIAWKLRRLKVVPEVIMSTIGKLALYPVIIAVCWALNTVANVYTFSTGRTYDDLSFSWLVVTSLGVVMAALQGLLNAVVFFAANRLVREHWWCLCVDVWNALCCSACGGAGAEDEGVQEVEGGATADGSAVQGKTGTGTAPAPTLHRTVTQLTGGRRSSLSGLHGARGAHMAQAIEQQADYIDASASAQSTGAGGGSLYGPGPGAGLYGAEGDRESGWQQQGQEGGEPHYSADSGGSARMSGAMAGMTRTASGWWEMARASTASFRSSFAPSLSAPRASTMTTLPNSRLHSAAVESTAGSTYGLQGTYGAHPGSAGSSAVSSRHNSTNRGGSVSSSSGSVVEMQARSPAAVGIINPILRGEASI